MDQQKWRPGEQAPESGSYSAYDEQGHNGGTVHLNKGDRFPATQHSGSYYTKVTNEQQKVLTKWWGFFCVLVFDVKRVE